MLTSSETDYCYREMQYGGHLLFQNRETRDEVYRWLILTDIPKSSLKRNSMRGQLLDPRYTFEGREIADKGLGNDYRHFHSVLYGIETRKSWDR